MYGAYLSFTQLKEYLKMRHESGMQACDEERDHAAQDYRTGRNFIKMYERIGQNFDRKQIRSEKA